MGLINRDQYGLVVMVLVNRLLGISAIRFRFFVTLVIVSAVFYKFWRTNGANSGEEHSGIPHFFKLIGILGLLKAKGVKILFGQRAVLGYTSQ